MAIQELILDASELNRLVLECGKCSGRCVLPVTAAPQPGHLANLHCPGCDQLFSQIEPLFHGIARFYDEVLRAAQIRDGVRVRFVLSVPAGEG